MLSSPAPALQSPPQVFKQCRMDTGAQQRNWGGKESDQPPKAFRAKAQQAPGMMGRPQPNSEATLSLTGRMTLDHVVPLTRETRANMRHTSKVCSKKIPL